MKNQQMPPTPIRLPPELRQWLRHQAVDADESLNAHVIRRLQASREAQEARNGEAGKAFHRNPASVPRTL